VRVGGDVEAVVARRLHDRLHLVDGELRGVAAPGVAEYAAGGGDLDQVRTFLVALAHRLPGLRGAVDHAFGRSRRAQRLAQLAVHAIGGVGMAAGGGQRLAGGVDARPFDQALVDGV